MSVPHQYCAALLLWHVLSHIFCKDHHVHVAVYLNRFYFSFDQANTAMYKNMLLYFSFKIQLCLDTV